MADTTNSLTDAVAECIRAAANSDAQPSDALRAARAVVLGMDMTDYIALETLCNEGLAPLLPYLRKYGAVLQGDAIMMRIGNDSVGIDVPVDKNRNLRRGGVVNYEVIVLPENGQGIHRPVAHLFAGQAKTVRFVAALAREVK